MAMTPINGINTMAISAMGRSGLYLVLDIVKKVSGLTLMMLSIRYGIIAFVVTMAFVQDPLGIIVNTTVNGKLLHYSFAMQMRDMAPSRGNFFCMFYIPKPDFRICRNACRKGSRWFRGVFRALVCVSPAPYGGILQHSYASSAGKSTKVGGTHGRREVETINGA